MPINFDLSGLPDKPDRPISSGRGPSIDLSGLPDQAEPTAQGNRQEMISTYQGPPSWDQLSFWQKLTMLTHPATMSQGLLEMTRRDPDEDQARTMNVLAISDKTGMSPALVDRNYEKLIKDPEVTGISWSGPRKGAAGLYDVGEAVGQMAFPALITAGLVTAPISTLIGIGTFTGVAEGGKFALSKATGQEYSYGMAAHELLPTDTSENVKALTDAAEFLTSALATGKVIKTWNKVIPAARETITERLFRDVITEQKFPEKVYISPEKIRSMQMGEFAGTEADLVKSLGLTGQQWRQALRMGVDIEVPAERIIKIADKPWWKKFKEGAPEFMRLSPFEEVRAFTFGKQTGQARPSGLLEAPGGPTAEAQVAPAATSAGGAGVTPPQAETLHQGEIRQATEALARVKEQIVKAGFPEEYADTTARLLDARSRTWAVQTGKDPAAYFDRWGLDFRRGWLPGKRRAMVIPKATGADAAETLVGWIKAQGGLWDESLPGEMKQFGGKEAGMVGLLSQKNGQTFGRLTESAIQDGWLPEDAMDTDFIALLSRDVKALKEGKPRPERIGSTKQTDQLIEEQETAHFEDIQKQMDQLTIEGWKVFEPGHQETVANLNPGDKLLVYGEEYVHQGFDESGNAILKDGEVIKADLFDQLPVEAMKGEGGAALFQGMPAEPGPVRNRAKAIPEQVGKVVASYYKNDKVKAHPDYAAAKAGDWEAAARLVVDVVKPETVDAIKLIAGDGAVFVAPHAEEAAGRNAIPMMLAKYYAELTGGSVDAEIIQINRAFHTGAKAMERMISRVSFDGAVTPGARYIIVDDVTTLGGTLAELSDHIQNGGGIVSGIVLLTNASRASMIAPNRRIVEEIERRFGNEVRELFGIDPQALTAAEAGYLHGFRDADTLRNRATKAREERHGRLQAKGVRQPEEVRPGPNPDPGELFQDSKTPKGSITFTPDKQAIINFFQAADLTTAPHEIFHLFMEDLRDVAGMPEAPEQVRQDWQTILDWLGAKDYESMTTAQKERFARAGEKYLGEGRAPSEELKPVFQRFRDWILSIYRALRDLNVNLTNKMRSVFDRLLATEDEILAARDALEVKALWDSSTPPLPGVSPEAWAKYNDLARAAALSTAEAIQKRRIEEWAEAKKEWTKAALEAQKADPDQTLINQIVERGGLNRKALEAEFDAKTIASLVRRRPGLVKEAGLVDPEQAALDLGTDTDALVDRLINSPGKQDFIDGFVREKAEAFDAAKEPLELAITEEYLAMLEKEAELLVQAQTQGRALKNSELKKWIREETGQVQVDDLVTESDALKAGLKKAAAAARQAMSEGKTEEALRQKERQREIVLRLKAKQEAREEIQKAKRYFKKVAQSKTIAWEFKTQILDLLADHGVLDRANFDREGMPGLRQFVEQLQEEGEMVDIADAILDRTNLNPAGRKSYEDLMTLKDAVKQLEHLGRNYHKLIASRRHETIKQAEAEIVNSIREEFKRKIKPGPGYVELPEREGLLDKFVAGVSAYHYELLKPETIFKFLDGHKVMGPVYENLFAPIKEAEDAELRLGAELVDRLKGIFEQIPKEQRKTWPTVKIVIPEIPQKFLTKEQILSVALNSGNEGNRKALRRGYGWDDAQIQAITDKLTKEEWGMVKDVWKLINDQYPMLDGVYREMTGVPLRKVEGVKIGTPFGEIEGQYYPLVFDRKLSWRADQFQMEKDQKDLFANIYAKPKPESGFTKERVGGTMPPRLDLGVVTQHLADVAHYGTHALGVRDVSKLVGSPDVRLAIEDALGESAFKQIMPWLQEVAHPRREFVSRFEKAFGHIRRNTTTVMLGLKMSTAMKQPLAITQTIAELGLVDTLRGFGKFYLHPFEAVEFIRERSEFINNRYQNWDREIKALKGKLDPSRMEVRDAMNKAFFSLIEVMDATVTYPTWLAAYQKAMEKEKWHEQKAIDYADMVVRNTQASGAAKDLASIQRGSEFKKGFTMFYTFFSSFWNRFVERNRAFKEGKVGIFNLLAGYWWLLVAPAVINDLVDKRRLLSPKETGAAIINYLLAGMPGVRDLATPILTGFDYRASPVYEIGTAVQRLGQSLTADEIKWGKVLKSATDTAGYAFGLPSKQIIITVDGALDLMSGETRNPLRLVLPEKKEKKEK